MKLTKKLIGLMIIASLGGAVIGCSSNKELEQNVVAPNPEQEDNLTTEGGQEENEVTDEETQPEEEEEKEENIKSDSDKEEETTKPVIKPEETKPETSKPAEKPAVKPEASKPVEKPAVKPEASKPAEKPAVKPEASKPAEKPAVKPEASKPVEKPVTKPEATKPEANKPEQKPEATKPVETPSMSASELYSKVVTSDMELPSLLDMDSSFFADTYGIDTSILKSYKVQMPMMMVHASEIAVFELKDVNDTQKVIAGINKRVEGLKAQWGSYLPEQLELVNNYKTAEKGNYVIFVVSEYADTIMSNFNANVK